MFESNHTIIPVYAGSRIVGQVQGDTFTKSIRGSKHILHTPKAIAFDVASLDQAEKAGAVNVRVTDSETGTVYLSTIAHIRKNGFELDRGFGNQIALTLNYWEVRRPGEVYQLPLLGGAA